MRSFLIILAIVAVTILGYLIWEQQRPVPLQVSGFVEADDVRVGSRVGGRIAEVLVSEGQSVSPGQALFRLDPFDLLATLAGARAELSHHEAQLRRMLAGQRPEEIEKARSQREQARVRLERLKAGPRPQEIQIARENLRIARADLEFANTENERLLRLLASEQAAPRELAETRRQLETARAGVAAAEQRLALLEAGTRAEEIAEAEAQLAQASHALALQEAGSREEDIARARADVAAAQARVGAIEVQLGELEVVSPCDCLVETVDLLPGELVAANAPAVQLLDNTRLWVRAYVPEARLSEVRREQIVQVRVDSLPDRSLRGRVSYIAGQAEFTPRNVQTPEERSKQVFRIKVMLEEGHDRVRVGMAADVLLDAEGAS